MLAIGIPVVTVKTNARLRELLISTEKERLRAEANEAAALEGIARADANRYVTDVQLGYNLLNAGDARLGSTCTLVRKMWFEAIERIALNGSFFRDMHRVSSIGCRPTTFAFI